MICYNGVVFSIGFIVGVFLALLNNRLQDPSKTVISHDRVFSDRDTYSEWLENQGVKSRRILDLDRSIYDPNFKKTDYTLESDFLYEKINLSCSVFSSNLHHSYAVSSSWGSKCNSLTFYGEKYDSYLKTIALNAKLSTWEFLCLAIFDLATHVLADWYVFSRDDVFFIPENLRRMVAHLDPSKLHYLGRPAVLWGVQYNTGQTVFVLSRGALNSVWRKFNSSASCKQSSKYRNNEDYILGKYLLELGVRAQDTRDEDGRERFHVFTPPQLLAPGSEGIFQKYFSRSVNPTVQGKQGFSPLSVSFHGIQTDYIFLYEFLLYNVKVFNYNGGYGNNLSRIYQPSDEVWKSFVRESFGKDYNVSRVTAEDYYKLWELWEPPEEFIRKLRRTFLNKTGRM